MQLSQTLWANPSEYLAAARPDQPVLLFSPKVLRDTANRFRDEFPGLVTFAIKSNPDDVVLSNLASAGLQGFDVASPHEMELVRRTAPNAALHYNNPVRSLAEIRTGLKHGVCSWSVDSWSELEKLAGEVPVAGNEIAVRFKLPVSGAAYNFGAKFGATSDKAVNLLARVAALGYQPALTFHPGTQCTQSEAWAEYIREAGKIALAAGVKLARLNVGGGFPSHRLHSEQPELAKIFQTIDKETGKAFGSARPALVCEPGRAMVAECYSLVAGIKAIRDGEHVFLNDGIYGGLAELPLIGSTDRIEVYAADGQKRSGAAANRTVFGPTCDSVDQLPGEVALPGDIREGDYLVFHGLGAYSTATVTRFNGYGDIDLQTVASLQG